MKKFNLSALTALVVIFYDYQFGNSLDRAQGQCLAEYKEGKLLFVRGLGRKGHAHFKGDPFYGFEAKTTTQGDEFEDANADFAVHLDYSGNFRVCDNEDLDEVFEQVQTVLKEAMNLAYAYTVGEKELARRHSRLVKTDDHWCGNFGEDKNLVEVRVGSDPYRKTPDHRVFVGGTDDHYLEKEFNSQKEALACFYELIAREKINEADVIRLGFERT